MMSLLCSAIFLPRSAGECSSSSNTAAGKTFGVQRRESSSCWPDREELLDPVPMPEFGIYKTSVKTRSCHGLDLLLPGLAAGR